MSSPRESDVWMAMAYVTHARWELATAQQRIDSDNGIGRRVALRSASIRLSHALDDVNKALWALGFKAASGRDGKP